MVKRNINNEIYISAAYQQVEENYQKAVIAEKKASADTVADGSLVEQSKNIRAEVKASVDDKLLEVQNNIEQVSLR